ncbi:hypothetical protein D3C71_443570 [compost metagenome]
MISIAKYIRDERFTGIDSILQLTAGSLKGVDRVKSMIATLNLNPGDMGIRLHKPAGPFYKMIFGALNKSNREIGKSNTSVNIISGLLPFKVFKDNPIQRHLLLGSAVDHMTSAVIPHFSLLLLCEEIKIRNAIPGQNAC